MRTCSASASASEWTATVPIPSRRQVRMIRQAISPRLAIRIFLNIGERISPRFGGPIYERLGNRTTRRTPCLVQALERDDRRLDGADGHGRGDRLAHALLGERVQGLHVVPGIARAGTIQHGDALREDDWWCTRPVDGRDAD